MIFIRKARDGKPTGFDKQINEAVFPGLQGGPHIHQVAAIATQMKEVLAPEFVDYIKQVIKNSQAMADQLMKLPEGDGPKYTIATNGTINHLVMLKTQCAPLNLTGSKVEKIFEAVGISVNKNSFPGDKSMMVPGGIRIGACALTTRGMKEDEFRQIAGFYDVLMREAARLQGEHNAANPGAPYKLVDFEKDVKKSSVVTETRKAVVALTNKFPMPGYEVEKLRYPVTAELPN
jgi:glycine hydroxymethyltransferase